MKVYIWESIYPETLLVNIYHWDPPPPEKSRFAHDIWVWCTDHVIWCAIVISISFFLNPYHCLGGRGRGVQYTCINHLIASTGFCHYLCMVFPIIQYTCIRFFIFYFLAQTAQIVSKPSDSIYIYLLPFRKSSSFWNTNSHCLSFGNDLFSM